jgi:formylmethanofuran dehydrogenase subunit C
MSAVTPDRLLGQQPADIGKLALRCGNRHVALRELFDIEGTDPAELVIRDCCARLDAIGADMRNGSIRVEGDVGNYLGRGMQGGSIQVSGNAGHWTASGLAGGTMTIEGDCGDFAGAAQPGDRYGMRGGVLLVHGSAGDRVGDHLRRGQILIRGDAGRYCGSRMTAGTIAVLGTAGAGAGYAMKRGTLLFSRLPDALPSTFGDCGEHELGFLRLLFTSLQRLDGEFARFGDGGVRVRRYVGDMANQGNGELLVPA